MFTPLLWRIENWASICCSMASLRAMRSRACAADGELFIRGGSVNPITDGGRRGARSDGRLSSDSLADAAEIPLPLWKYAVNVPRRALAVCESDANSFLPSF